MTQADGDELAALDQKINELLVRAEQARQSWWFIDAELRQAQQRRAELAARQPAAASSVAPVETALPTYPSAGSASTATASQSAQLDAAAPTAVAGPKAGANAEASTHTVQNALFILGGLLLGVAAIVFTAVAWATFGVGGRATILAVVTSLALATPPVALARRLRATAETFAAIGLLLVALDGYAAWYVNLLGVNSMPASRYIGLVSAVTAVAAALYRVVTRLTGPSFVMLIAMQPVLPALAWSYRPPAAQWAVVFAVIALADLGIVAWGRRPAAQSTAATAPRRGHAALRALAWVAYAVSVGVGAVFATAAQFTSDGVSGTAWSGLALLALAGVLAAGAILTAAGAFELLAGLCLVPAVAIAVGRVAAAAWPAHNLTVAAGVVAGIAVSIRVGRRWWRGQWRLGVAVSASILLGLLGLVLTALTLSVAVRTVAAAAPFWHADLRSSLTTTTATGTGWQLLAAIGLALVGAVSLLAANSRSLAISLAASLAIAALPVAAGLPWWGPAVADLVGAAVLVLSAVAGGRNRARDGEPGPVATAIAPALAGAALVILAILTSLARPSLTAGILFGLCLLGAASVAVCQRLPKPEAIDAAAGADALMLAKVSIAVRSRRARSIAGTAVAVALIALPPALGSTLAALDRPGLVVARWTAAAVLLGLAVLWLLRSSQTWFGYMFAGAAVAVAVWPTVAAITSGDGFGVYGGAQLFVLALALWALPISQNQSRQTYLAPASLAAIPGMILLAVDVLPAVLSVVVLPYAWLGAIWSGRPTGIGLAPADVAIEGQAGFSQAIALGLLALASATVAYSRARSVGAAVAGLGVGGPTAVIVGVAAAQAPWPSVAAVTLLLGMVMITVAALARLHTGRRLVLSGQALIYVGGGLAGSLTMEWSTLTGLGLTVVVASVIGVVGRSLPWRILGWLGAVFAAVLTAIAGGYAASLRTPQVAFAVLAVATLVLFVGAAAPIRNRSQSPKPGSRAAESRAIETAAHAAAGVAVLFSVSDSGHAAAVFAIWGVAVGLRAILPGTGGAGRAGLAAAAAGSELAAWWLLLATRQVALVEAYTLPLAGVALLAGLAALRARPELRSWIAYGPALLAGFLPSLATVLITGSTGAAGEWQRRLLLGVAALATVVGGSVRRRQAPVVIGGAVLVALALHEVVLVWDLLPRWIPLAAGGTVLIGLAITYERRRRDLTRVRDAISRMS